MPRYNYECNACRDQAYSTNAESLIINNSGDKELPLDLYEELVLFETYHSINPNKKELEEALECPRCGGHDCTRTVYGAQITGFIKGYGFLDKEGARRDMNRFKLATDDPYAQYRVPGEVDHIDSTLKKQGQHDPKTKHFLTAATKQKDQSDTNNSKTDA